MNLFHNKLESLIEVLESILNADPDPEAEPYKYKVGYEILHEAVGGSSAQLKILYTSKTIPEGIRGGGVILYQDGEMLLQGKEGIGDIFPNNKLTKQSRSVLVDLAIAILLKKIDYLKSMR